MAIMTESKSLTRAPNVPKLNAEIAPKTYKHSLVDSKVHPVDSLITNISGIDWTVFYYSQILGENEEPKDFQVSDNAYQQYLKITNYNLKLQGDLNRSFDDTQNRLSVTGTAILYPKLIPNVGDVIIADIGDGKAGYFTVTEVSQKSMFANRTYEINFTLVGYMDSYIESILESRVVKTGNFIKDYIQYGQNPVLVGEEQVFHDVTTDAIKDLLGSWLSEYYSHEIDTIRVPTGNNSYVYDPFITSLIIKLFSIHDHPLIGNISTYNCDIRTLTSYTDIWSATLSREEWVLYNCFKHYHVVATEKFNHNVHLRNIKFSKIDGVVLPYIREDYTNDTLDILSLRGHILNNELDRNEKHTALLRREGIEVPYMGGCGTYVVSEDVYNLTTEPVTPIEQQLRNYFQEEAVNVNVIMKYVYNRRKLTKLERFYTIPLCLLLLLHSLRSR